MSYDLPPDIERIVQDVQRAPSVFNTRPWWLQFRPPDHIELWLRGNLDERDGVARAGPRGGVARAARAEPRGGVARARARGGVAEARAGGGVARARAREYVISCGAALFNLRLAIRMAGHDLVVWRLPDPAYADPMHPPALLASVEIVTGRVRKPTIGEQELYEAIGRRHTNRQPYTTIPVPLAIITAMEGAASREGCHLRLLRRRQARRWMRLTREVDSDPAFSPPFRNHVSLASYGPSPKNRHPRTRKDFWAGGEKRRFEREPQLMALSTDDDEPIDWLRAGQALQRAILTGTRYSASARYGLAAKYSVPHRHGVPARHHLLKPDELAPYGLSVSFLTQPLERDDLEGQPRRWPGQWGYPEVPQMVMRVGYAAVQSQAEQPPKTHMADEWSQPPRNPPPGALPTADSEFRT
jgi:hypothetical protein